ncbi:MAG: 16S rRNA (cytosine(1402)-N(4))-methyltransferase RsmH [Lachnospiraceae bacterium]|nr:16S rRNA (cytosine(1402)-N(4))-methyltransferase RsmH [Lachnospiraceae bacterium]
MEFNHYSVLLEETIEQLHIKPEGIYLDGTLGGGGHAEAVLRRLAGKGHLFGVDQDEAAVAAASERLRPYGEKVTVIRENYRNAAAVLRQEGVEGVDGIVLDLGVSSYQFDTADRGFSYRYDTTLDMRMDSRNTLSAKEIVNGYTEKELFHVIKDYGEEPFAKNIAKHIVRERENKEITTTFELNEIIKNAIPAKMRQGGGHPSKRTYQAIRIECNHELEVLKDSLDEMIDFLRPGGRICIITFHSLEDRIVKNIFRTGENPCICPPEFPVCVCGRRSKGKVITKKPIFPSEEELENNSRSRSAKLRVFERKQI